MIRSWANRVLVGSLGLLMPLGLLGSPVWAAPFVVPNPYASGFSRSDISIRTLFAFGDSYSSVNVATPNRKWAAQMLVDVSNSAGGHEVASLVDVAHGGATGGTYPPSVNDFAHQVDEFFTSAHRLTPSDLTVVYLGYNDMGHTSLQVARWPGMEKVLADYRSNLQRLINYGLASGSRRILLVLPHDYGHTPWLASRGVSAVVRQHMQQWNAALAKLAQQNSAANVVAVDLFTAVDCIVNQPSDFGFVNVTDIWPTTEDPNLWLYANRNHFGEHGQTLIREVIDYYLTKGWDWANTYKDPATARQKFVAELQVGNVFPVKCTSIDNRTVSEPVNFDPLEYIASYPDLISAFGPDPTAGLAHYEGYGRFEGRSINFDGFQYIASNDDLISAFGANRDAGAWHYIVAGESEGRVTDGFNATQYLANYSDLQGAFGADIHAATLHYLTNGFFEGRTDD